MSHPSRRILLVAALAGCFLVGSMAPAASEAKVSTKDLLQMDKKILESNDQILKELNSTQELLNQVSSDVDLGQLLSTVNDLSAKLDEVLGIVGNLTGKLDDVLGIVGSLSNNLTELLGLGPLTCDLLGICPSAASSP